MTTRDLYLKILDFEKVKQNLNWDFGYWGGTIDRWKKEGLPNDIALKGPDRNYLYGEFINGPGLTYPMASFDPNVLYASGIVELFDLDPGPAPFQINWWYSPRFDYEIIHEDDEKIEYVDTLGIRCLNYKDQRSMPHWLEFPLKTKKDWDKIKEERLSIKNISQRYTAENISEYIKQLKNRDFPLVIYGSPIGFFGSIRFLIGEPAIYYMYYDEPALIKDIVEHLTKLWLIIAEEVTSLCDFDAGYFFEDMAGKQGSLIGPDIFKEFMSPYYKKIIDFAKTKNVRHFIVDSDGFVEDLIPLFIDAGMTGMLPFEIRAGNDIERIRKIFPKFQILGGIDKTALQSKYAIDKEIEKVKRMLPLGGYIPFVDHAYPPDISYQNYEYFRKRISETVKG